MDKEQSQQKSRSDYASPPIVEAVFGITFQPIDGLKIPHYGLFWNLIKAELPSCEHASPIVSPDQPISVGFEGLPLPRIWYISEDGARLLQVQGDRLLFNWRQMADESYPRFESIYQTFIHYFEMFNQFLIDNELPPVQVISTHLAYINHIRGEIEGKEICEKDIFKEASQEESPLKFLQSKSASNWQRIYPFDEKNLHLISQLQQGRSKIDHKTVYNLELKAESLSKPESLSSWFDNAHEVIINGFDDLTTDDAQQKLWGRE